MLKTIKYDPRGKMSDQEVNNAMYDLAEISNLRQLVKSKFLQVIQQLRRSGTEEFETMAAHEAKPCMA